MRFLFVLAFTFSAVAQPFPGTERAVSSHRDAARPNLKYAGAAAGDAGGFLATWSEWTERPRLFGAFLTRDGKVAGDPFFIGYPTSTDVVLHARGGYYEVVNKLPYGYPNDLVWEVTPRDVYEVGIISHEDDPPVENANGEHLIVEWDGADFTITFAGRDNAIHGPPVRTRDVRYDSSVVQVRPAGDEWALLTASPDGVVQWLRIDHLHVVSMINILPPPSFSRPGSRILSTFATHGPDVGFAWVEVAKIDNLESPTWERALGYATVNVESGNTRGTTIDTTQMRINKGDYRTPKAGTPSVIFNGREFVYAWTWLDYSGNAEVRVVHGEGAPRVLARHRDVFPYDLHPVLGAGDGRDLLLWHPRIDRGRPNDRMNVLARAIDAASSIDDGVAPTLVSAGTPAQREPREATGPAGTFVAWTEVGDDTQIRGRLFPAVSSPGESFTIAGLTDIASVSVAANARTFLVLWRERNPVSPYQNRLWMRRYDAAGAAVDAQPIFLGTAKPDGLVRPVAVLADGDSFVLGWTDNPRAIAMRVPDRGAVTAAPVTISEATAIVDTRLVRAGGRIVALWVAAAGNNLYALKGAAMRDTLETEPVADLWLTFTRPFADKLVLAAEGTDRELMVALGGSGSATENTDCVRVRRFGLNLQPLNDASTLGCIELVVNATNRLLPDVAWDGTRWWALYSYSEATATALELWPFDANGSPQAPKRLPFAQGLLDMTIHRTTFGLTADYVRADESAAMILRAYQLPLFAQSPKTRSTRH